MGLHIRTTKTGSGKTAVQIVRYERRRVVVVKHVGSVSDKKELQRLKQKTKSWIETLSGQQSLFSERTEPLVVQLNQIEYHVFRYGVPYESLYEVSKQFKYHWLRKGKSFRMKNINDK